MNGYSSYRWLFLPLILLVLLATALFFERTGLSYEGGSPPPDLLDPIEEDADNPLELDSDSYSDKECLVLYDSLGIESSSVSETVDYTLQSMRVKYDLEDVNSSKSINLGNYDNVVIAFSNLDKIKDWIFDLTEWVQQGGRVLFAVRPDPSPSFTAIYRKLGIREKSDEVVTVAGLEFVDNLFPGTKGMSLGQDFFDHGSTPVQLDAECQVHLQSADEYKLPILWERAYGNGRFVVINSNQFSDKSSRGTIAAAYSLLDDVIAYPVINSALFFIDDFPSPIPEGRNESITKEYGRDLQSFYINIWWPDMQSLARRYGVTYTGVVIETYEDTVSPPFKKQTQTETFSYLSNLLLKGGGELGWHGYNHVPLCLADSDCNNQLGYPTWPSEEAMQSALAELHDFTSSLAGGSDAVTYVPPSNVLSSQTRTWLKDALPGLRIIASVYLPDEENSEYEQEFEEATDGVIELPRVFAGFVPNEFMRWSAINELAIHFIHSQFVHPDDLLDEERSGGHTWTYLRNNLDDYLLWLYRSYPGIRNMTAREGAMAVQRYDRLKVDRTLDHEGYHIHLDNFYDEAYFLVRTEFTPVLIENGEMDNISDDLYLVKALSTDVLIRFNDDLSVADSEENDLIVNLGSEVEIVPLTGSKDAEPLEDPVVEVVDQIVVVQGTEDRGLRVRVAAGTGNDLLFIVNEGEEFQIISGPISIEGVEWLQIQSVGDENLVGWAVQDFLIPIGETD